MARKAITRIYPAGKLPCLEHNDRFIGDSTDIMWYIEEQFTDRSLTPELPADKALVHIFDDWADESLYMYEMYVRFCYPHNAAFNLPRMLHADKPLVQKIMPKLIARGVKSILKNQGLARKSEQQVLTDLNRHIDSLNDRLQTADWLVANTISLADISVYSMITCIHDSREGQQSISRHSRVLDWLQRVRDATGGKVQGSMPPIQ